MSPVIERLRDAERAARGLQLRRTDAHAAAWVRTWPSVATAARTAWTSLPHSAIDDPRVVERIAWAASALESAADRNLWPGDTGPDPGLARIADRFESAAGAKKDRMNADESTEARRLIASTLWTAARAIGTAARDHAFDVRYDSSMPIMRRQRTSELARDASRRFRAAEQLAANLLFGRQVTGEPEQGGLQLRNAIARWDIEAHRALVGQRTTATLHAVSFHQVHAAAAFGRLVDTAHGDGVIDGWTRERLAPVLTLAETAWKDVHQVAQEFSFATVQLPVALHEAGRDLRTGLSSVLPQSPDGHRQILGALSEHLASSLNIAAVARDLVDDGELRAPARAVARVISERVLDAPGSVVSPEDVRRGISVILPADARDVLAQPTAVAVDATAEGLARSAALDSLYRIPAPASKRFEREAGGVDPPVEPPPTARHGAPTHGLGR